jgi:hypothetical protein
MSERRTYTLDDRAVEFLSAVPKDRNSQFVSDLIVSFFDGKDLLSVSDWGFLSSKVKGLRENRDSGLSVSDVSPGSSNPVDLEKARFARVLSKLNSLDLSNYQAFCDFLALPDVRVGGFLDWTLDRLRQESGHYVEGGFFGKQWEYYEGWDFVKLIPSSVFERRSSDAVEFYLKRQVSLLNPGFGFGSFLKALFEVVSSRVLRDLVYREKYGIGYSEYVKKQMEEEEDRKRNAEKAQEESEKKKAEKERQEALRVERGKADFISSVEAGLREKLFKGRCGASSVFSKCGGRLTAGYFIDPDGWTSSSGGFKSEVEYAPVLCEKHLSWYFLSAARQKYTFIYQE